MISYDLNKPGRDYKTLTDALEKVGARRVLYSQWIVRWNNTTAALIRQYIWTFMDANDRLLVSCLDSADWAGMNLMVDPNTI
jgi:hypothetical protein